MHTRAWRWLLSFGLSLLVGSFSGAAPVRALAADADHFTFLGTTTAMTPMLFVGGTGSFSFSAGFTGATQCAGTSADSDDLFSDVDTPPSRCELFGSGTYNNVVCGTGFMHGTATLTEYDGSTVSDIYDFTFDITYVAGSGTLAGFATERGAFSESSPIAGHVLFAPTSFAGPPNCVTSLSILGTVASTV